MPRAEGPEAVVQGRSQRVVIAQVERVASRLARVLGLLLAAGLVAGAAASGPRALHVQPSPLEALVPGLNEGPAEARFDFAVLVLDALIAEHQAELEQARLERPRSPATQQKLHRWGAATTAFLNDLRVAQATLYTAREVEVHRDVHGPLVLRVDGSPIWVAWPRVEKQWTLERALAEAFCRRHACPVLGETASRPVRAGVAGGRADGGSWSLMQGQWPAWESGDGVRCEFGDVSDRASKATRCERLATELRSLVPMLQEAALPVRDIQWEQLGIVSEPGSPQHRLRVNDRGDYLRAALPALASEPVDWNAVGQWLNARLRGRPARATVLPARQ
jgi:hypothetical protein